MLDVQRDEIPHIPQSCREDYSGALLQEGDIIIADTAEDETTGKACEIDNLQGSSIVSGLHTMVCRPRKQMASGYLGYYLNSNAYHHQLLPLMQGIKVLSLSRSNIQKTSVSYPAEVEEQQLIASYFKRFDNLVTLHQRKLEKVKELKQAYLSEMFPAEGETIPKRRFKGFTGDWEQRKFEEAFIERREKTERENEDTLLSCAINGMYLNSELFGHFRGTTTIGYLRVKKNDLILSAQNLHLGNANVNLRFEHGIISPAYKVYDLNNCDPEFVQAWVKEENTKNFFLAATTEGASQCRKNIEWETLGKQAIPMPSIEEQRQIGAFFKNLDNLITLHQRKLEKLKNIKKSMLEKMFV